MSDDHIIEKAILETYKPRRLNYQQDTWNVVWFPEAPHRGIAFAVGYSHPLETWVTWYRSERLSWTVSQPVSFQDIIKMLNNPEHRAKYKISDPNKE